MIYVIGPHDPRRTDSIDTTSRSKTWSRCLSPFVLGPVELYGDYVAKNIENAYQFTKVYDQYMDDDGNPTPAYFKWAEQGWNDPKPHRYPMGKGVKPEYSYWDGEHLSYIESRKKIYIPLYSSTVRDTPAFSRLAELAMVQDVYLWDYDGYNHRELNMDLNDVLDCGHRRCGHAFVLMAMLEGEWGFPRLID